jgi:patatin-related protein
MTFDAKEFPVSELRLALVLYGGVSLCIYMHGTTKEINRLVSASASLSVGSAVRATPSETVYRELLEKIAERDRVRTEVSVDVIAGTSAGGINGVYLAKALARNLSQDALRDLWLQRGDIGGLLCGPQRVPWKARVPYLLARLPWKAPLRGEKMAQWLHEALIEMDTTPASAELSSLMPLGSRLYLMVTMTDFYGYDRQVPIWAPPIVHDEQHRHVFHFTHEAGADRFGETDNVALAFAARATSCFPGAFEPVNRERFCERLPGGGTIDDEFFRIYELSGAYADDTYFIDGGVLDNRPFAPAIDAIREKPAEVEVRRKLLYLDPDPPPATGRAPGRLPTTIATVVGALSGLPRKQPILDSLLEIDRLNEGVMEVRDVIEGSFESVALRIQELTPEMLSGVEDPQAVQAHHEELQMEARRQLGIGYAPYIRLKIAAAIDRIAGAVCDLWRYPPESSQAMLVKDALLQWACEKELFKAEPEPTEQQVEFLRGLDVGYALRRIEFTLAGVNWLYRGDRSEPLDPDRRAALNGAKAHLWNAVQGLEVSLGTAVARIEGRLTACFPERELTRFLADQGLDAPAWAARKKSDLSHFIEALTDSLRQTLHSAGVTLYLDLLKLTNDWSEQHDLLVRYVGFALWDAQLYPLQSAVGGGERDAVDVMRMSPLDATLLSHEGDPPKLDGIADGHFGAFFARSSRENDYLVGRLDGAERLIALLLEDSGERREWSRRAFLAILDEEQEALKTAGGLSAEMRSRAQSL